MEATGVDWKPIFYVLEAAMTGALLLSVERWADEEAAELPGARDIIRRALLKTTQSMLREAVPAFTAACSLLARARGAPHRPAGARPLGQQAIVAASLAGLVATVGGCLALWGTYTHHGALGLLGFCPCSAHSSGQAGGQRDAAETAQSPSVLQRG